MLRTAEAARSAWAILARERWARMTQAFARSAVEQANSTRHPLREAVSVARAQGGLKDRA